MLNFILEEWENDNSCYFNGQNKLLTTTNIDTKEDLKMKQSHNSKYWRYLNTINIATLYRNSVFYLPCFGDFRGEIIYSI